MVNTPAIAYVQLRWILRHSCEVQDLHRFSRYYGWHYGNRIQCQSVAYEHNLPVHSIEQTLLVLQIKLSHRVHVWQFPNYGLLTSSDEVLPQELLHLQFNHAAKLCFIGHVEERIDAAGGPLHARMKSCTTPAEESIQTASIQICLRTTSWSSTIETSFSSSVEETSCSLSVKTLSEMVA